MKTNGGWRQADDLGSKVRAGLLWSLCNNLFGRAGQVVMGIVLAHLLAPREFGVFSAALVAFALIINVSELGVSVAIVREPTRTEVIAPTVATLSLASASTLAAALFFGAPWIASALNTPAAAGSLRVLSLALVIAGLTAVPAAIVQQRFRQDVRMAADVTSLLVSVAVAVPMAARGFGASSLAWAWVASNAASAGILMAFVGRHWRPGFRREEAGRLLRFGLPLAASSLLVFAVLNVDYVVVSRLLGPVALGVYVLAFNLSSWPVNMFSASVRAVSLPGFARMLDSPSELGAAFTRSLGQLLAVALPICALLGGLALPAVRFVYGDRWASASEALVWLAVVGGLRVTFELAYDFIVAIGDSRTVLYVQVLWLVTLAPALIIGAHSRGIAGVGAAQLAVAGGVICPTYLMLLRRRHVALRGVVAATVRPILGAGAALLVARLVYPQFDRPLPGLVVAALAGLCADALVLWPTVRRWRAGRTRPVLAGTVSASGPVHAEPAPLTTAMVDAVAGVGARGAR
jgi:PST family polysaccharide transporter